MSLLSAVAAAAGTLAALTVLMTLCVLLAGGRDVLSGLVRAVSDTSKER